ncbi:MAG: hypothetical protein ACR2PI_15340 [Hyphomicrobiaceae bacterium]
MMTNRRIRTIRKRDSVLALALTLPLALALNLGPASAQASIRDRIADIITGSTTQSPQKLAQSGTPSAPAGKADTKDPRAGDKDYEQARRLMRAIDDILADTAQNRTRANKLPSKDDFILTPLWTETREDRQDRIRALMDSALGIVTDVPIVDIQKRIETLRKNITDIENNIVLMREKQLTAPQDSLMPGVISDTVASLGKEITDAEQRIALNREQIETAKDEVHKGLQKSGIKLTKKQVDLLIGSVLSGDVVRLVAVFNSAKLIDQQLSKLMAASGDNMGAARKYFAMHAALFAILVHAQDTVIDKIDRKYLPKLKAIRRDLKAAQARTRKLLRGQNRADQRRVLESNLKSQKLAADAARGYNRYLLQQREQVARARRRAAHDLSIADNTYETVEASYQLRNLMQNTRSTFEALQKLEAPTFEQIFKNEELRREFENLTRKLEVPTG